MADCSVQPSPRGRGGKRCVAMGCSNTNASEPEGISLFLWPKDPAVAQTWTLAVKKTRKGWQPTSTSVLCSVHFTKESFEEGPLLRAELGIPTKRPRVLKKEATPTIFLTAEELRSGQDSPCGLSGDRPRSRPRAAFEKRDRQRVSLYINI